MYLDKKTATLYFWPPSDIKTATVYAPTLETIVQMTGVSNVEWRGFTFECAEGTALALRDCTDSLLSGSTVRNVQVVPIGDFPPSRLRAAHATA
jgi:hypothetical protein